MSGNIEAHEYASEQVIREMWYLKGFMQDIEKFNEMYRMPTITFTARMEVATRLSQFKSILEEECNEIEEIIMGVANGEGPLLTLIKLSDLLGDIIVYCTSEARRWNIPIDKVLRIIMDSNFSKMGADGKPIYDERGKLLKGPNYWKPEPKIEQLLIEWNGRS